MKVNYCLLPNESQRIFGEYLERRYGRNVKFNYFAVVSNPNPSKGHHVNSVAIAISYYSPFTKSYIREAITCTTKVLI